MTFTLPTAPRNLRDPEAVVVVDVKVDDRADVKGCSTSDRLVAALLCTLGTQGLGPDPGLSRPLPYFGVCGSCSDAKLGEPGDPPEAPGTVNEGRCCEEIRG